MSTLNSAKVAGFVLLGVGLLMVFFAVWGVYGVFTGSYRAPVVVPMHAVTMSLVAQPGTPPAILELLKADVATQLLNMVVLYALMAFILMAGSRIASLGVKMLTPAAK
jgi:hypothetical protein